jgi:hypothetical protein
MDLKNMPAQTSQELPSSERRRVAPNTAKDRLLDFLNNLRKLETDWDGDGALKPDEGAIDDSIAFAEQLFFKYPAVEIEQACAGAMGEIVIELRNGEKAVEFIFYPNKKWKYVSVGGETQPEQGVFEMKKLSKLITWLNDEA